MAGTCVVGGMCGRGACMAAGHVWLGDVRGGGCVAGETATSAYFGDVKENAARSVEMSSTNYLGIQQLCICFSYL